MRKLYTQHRALKTVQPRIEADPFMVVAFLRTVNAKCKELLGKLVIVRRHEPTVAHAAEVLGRIEREAPDLAHRSGADATLFGPDRLSRVFHKRNSVLRHHLA